MCSLYQGERTVERGKEGGMEGNVEDVVRARIDIFAMVTKMNFILSCVRGGVRR